MMNIKHFPLIAYQDHCHMNVWRSCGLKVNTGDYEYIEFLGGLAKPSDVFTIEVFAKLIRSFAIFVVDTRPIRVLWKDNKFRALCGCFANIFATQF
jgi:hypothetical protein